MPIYLRFTCPRMVILIDSLKVNSLPDDARQIIPHVKPEWDLSKVDHKVSCIVSNIIILLISCK